MFVLDVQNENNILFNNFLMESEYTGYVINVIFINGRLWCHKSMAT